MTLLDSAIIFAAVQIAILAAIGLTASLRGTPARTYFRSNAFYSFKNKTRHSLVSYWILDKMFHVVIEEKESPRGGTSIRYFKSNRAWEKLQMVDYGYFKGLS